MGQPPIDHVFMQQIIDIPNLDTIGMMFAAIEDAVNVINETFAQGNPIVFPRTFQIQFTGILQEFDFPADEITVLLHRIVWVPVLRGPAVGGKRRVTKRKALNGRGSNGYMTGDGLFGDIADRFKILFKGRSEIPSSVTKEIEKYGNDAITQMTICRHSIPSAIQAVINKASSGNVQKAMKDAHFDKLFHLYLRVVLSSGKSLKIEKNENVSISPASDKSNAECVPVNMEGKHVTLGQLIENAMKKMGDNFFKYNFESSNCQHFVDTLLTASGLNRNSYHNFIMQDIPTVLKSLPKWAKAIGHFATNTADRVKGFIFGRGVDGSNVQSVLFIKDQWTLPEARKWMRDHGFKVGKVHDTKKFHRFRQFDPDPNMKHRLKNLPNGIVLLLEF